MPPFEPGFPECRLKAAKLRPYYASALWSLIPVITPGLGTMGVDGKNRIYIDPVVFQKWNLDQNTSVTLHEILHRVLRHDKRAKNLNVSPEDRKLWNICADLEVNQILRTDGITNLPGSPCFPETMTPPLPKDLMAEEYWMLLKQRQQDQEKKQGGKSQPQDGDDKSGESGAPSDGDGSPQPKGQPKAGDKPGEGKCGSCAHNGKEGHEQGDPTDAEPGQSEVEAELASRQFAKAVQEHIANRGTAPAGLQRWAATVNAPPVIPWDTKLRAYLRESLDRKAGSTDLSFAKPARRQWGLWAGGDEVCLPSSYSPVLQVFAVIDTSGSMDDAMLQDILTEIRGVCRAVGAPIRVVCVDSETYGLQAIEEGQKIQVKGGGGTDMRLGIELARTSKPQPAVCIVLTDGYTPWPKEKPGSMAVIACIVPRGTTNGIPDFIKTISIDDHKRK